MRLQLLIAAGQAAAGRDWTSCSCLMCWKEKRTVAEDRRWSETRAEASPVLHCRRPAV